MKQVYVIGKPSEQDLTLLSDNGYRVTNIDIGAPRKEMLPMRVGIMLKSDSVFLGAKWFDNVVYRTEYRIAEELKMEFVSLRESKKVVEGEYLNVIKNIASIVCEHLGCSIDDVFLGKHEVRSLERSQSKQIVFYALRKYGFAVAHIASAMPNTTRCDVYHGFKTISGYVCVSKSFRKVIANALEDVYNKGYVNSYVHTKGAKFYEIGELLPIFMETNVPEYG